ncbi:hypothetical protein L6452_14476 [Arctium lappa]|uniref:Uncharacterized protein n=1 Tax=Arctium lappa TaxID=4217 RepID=A0ACB9CKZ5_ARCLA|nr:hypothetical protein L6452_14476 [Arctium lappa]
MVDGSDHHRTRYTNIVWMDHGCFNVLSTGTNLILRQFLPCLVDEDELVPHQFVNGSKRETSTAPDLLLLCLLYALQFRLILNIL